jgi:UDP-4-amino-4,6-dideoxy-N-acetyl-beta-L-altrosamine transaminase
MRIPYGKQSITQEDLDTVVETLQSDFLTQGPKVQEFELAFADYVNAEYAVAVNNATSGLHLSVLALGLLKGERVITTTITFAASANCVRYAGGEVWFADIDPYTYLLSIESVRKLIESKPPGFFKGIIPVDFAGHPINSEELRILADTHNLWIIEDACHAPGGSYQNSSNETINCGAGRYSDLSVFSFHPVKHIACGEGGMVTTNSKELYDKLMLLRTHGITKNNLSENHGGWFYEMHALGFNYRLTDFQAALGISQLSRNDESVRLRNKIATKYKRAFDGKIKYQSTQVGYLNAHHLFIIEVDNRKELYESLKENGVYAQVHYIPVHTLPYYKAIGYDTAFLTNAQNYYQRCISLPMYPTLTDEEQDYVIELVNRYAK